MKIGFTGTREGMTEKQKDALWALLVDLDATQFDHGDCEGSDEEASLIAKKFGCFIVSHPPTNHSHRAFTTPNVQRIAKPYLDRNRDIVDETEVLIACPKENEEQQRGGTWYTVRFARKQGKTVHVLQP